MNLAFKKRALIWALLMAVIAAAIIIAVVFTVRSQNGSQAGSGRRMGSVVANGRECAKIGADVLDDGGSAVDSAIATLICESTMVPQSMGLGGGFVGILYHRPTRAMEGIIARETAPASAHQDMFVNLTSVKGAQSGAIPGELKGYWEMHQKYGKLPWKTLFTPSIKLCREGFYVSQHMTNAIKSSEARLRQSPYLARTFLKPDGSFYAEGDIIKRISYAETLEKVAEGGADEFYIGEVGRMFREDINEQDGNLTAEDFKNYQTRWYSENHVEAPIYGGYKLYTTPQPTSGPILAFIMRLVNELYTDSIEVFWQRVVEAFKHAYGQRTHLGDDRYEPTMRADIQATLKRMKNDEFIKNVTKSIHDDSTSLNYSDYGALFDNSEDHGTANIVVLGTDGSAVVITSTINNYFGSKIASERTGIILNDEMDDFSTPGLTNGFGLPPSPANFIQPHKMPMSSMCPGIILDENGDIRMLIGSAGGSRITTAVSIAIIKYLILNTSMKEAIDDGRLHHQLAPMHVESESVPDNIISYLEKVGHSIVPARETTGFAAVTAIGLKKPVPDPCFDRRRLGSKIVIQGKNKMQH